MNYSGNLLHNNASTSFLSKIFVGILAVHLLFAEVAVEIVESLAINWGDSGVELVFDLLELIFQIVAENEERRAVVCMSMQIEVEA